MSKSVAFYQRQHFLLFQAILTWCCCRPKMVQCVNQETNKKQDLQPRNSTRHAPHQDEFAESKGRPSSLVGFLQHSFSLCNHNSKNRAHESSYLCEIEPHQDARTGDRSRSSIPLSSSVIGLKALEKRVSSQKSKIFRRKFLVKSTKKSIRIFDRNSALLKFDKVQRKIVRVQLLRRRNH